MPTCTGNTMTQCLMIQGVPQKYTEKPLQLVPTDIMIAYDRNPYTIVAWYRQLCDPVECFNKREIILPYLDHDEKEIVLLGDANFRLCQQRC